MSRTVVPGSGPRRSRAHTAVRLISAARTVYAGQAQRDEETIFCARTDVAKCLIVEVEWILPSRRREHPQNQFSVPSTR